MRECLKNFRLSERPIFSVVDLLNTELINVRKFGEGIGLTFPRIPPPRTGANVPRDRGPGTVSDSLKFVSREKVLTCPQMSEYLDKVDMDRDVKEDILDIMEEYRESVGDKIVGFYNSVADTLNQMDDHLIFHFDLFSHVNASMKELLRAKLASLFKADVRDEILLSLKKADKTSNGIFGGDKKIRSALAGATKCDSVLNKALISNGTSRSRRSKHHRDKECSRSRSTKAI